MIRVVWWMCALLTLADAHVYGRCELANELRNLGLHPDHISTWVCIAYHESRFDTAARNHGSGDHGIFQISELYWCGPGKACGQPCSAFRDDNIADDVECALQVHEEHTRLQGDGFLAWVVYPQHCKQNTKKYIIECDSQVKFSDTHSKSRAYYNYDNDYNSNFTSNTQYTNVNKSLPPYLLISSLYRGSYGKALSHGKYGNRDGNDWLNYKVDNIDDLKLPYKSEPVAATPITTTTTTTYVPPVRPWRVIETNQFRNRIRSNDKTTSKPASAERYNFEYATTPTISIPSWVSTAETTTITPRNTTASISTSSVRASSGYNAPFTSTTHRPSITSRQWTLSTTVKPIASTFTYSPQTTVRQYQTPSSTTTVRAVNNSSYKPFTRSTTTFRPFSAVSPTEKTSVTSSPAQYTFTSRTTTTKQVSQTTASLGGTTKQFLQSTPTRATVKEFPQWTRSTQVSTSKPFFQWTTPTLGTRGTTKQFIQFTTPTPVSTKATTKLFPQWITPTTLTTRATTKQLVQWTTPTPTTKLTSNSERITTLSPEQIRQSVFDLYLKPATQKPPMYNFAFNNNFKFKSLFNGSTTTAVPKLNPTG